MRNFFTSHAVPFVCGEGAFLPEASWIGYLPWITPQGSGYEKHRFNSARMGWRSEVTLGGRLEQVGGGDVGRVVAVAAVRLGEAVHVQQLPVGHLAVGVEDLLACADRPHAHHLEAVLREETGGTSFILSLPAKSGGLTGVNSRLAL